MRLIYTTSDLSKGQKFSKFLSLKKIENQFDMIVNTDWGSSDYGSHTAKVWIFDEDQLDQALQWIDTFEKNPDDPQFLAEPIKLASKLPGPGVEKEATAKNIAGIASLTHQKVSLDSMVLRREPFDKMTLFFLLLCSFTFIVGLFTTSVFNTIPLHLPYTILTSPPINKELMYDYPRAFEFLDKLVKLYGIDALQTPQDLPTEGKYLLSEFYNTPYWKGGYELFVQKIQGNDIPQPLPLLFQKIREGEIWRTFTPALLHNDILHLIFNMIWLAVLGKQMGQRLPASRYLMFLLFVGVFSNTCEYLVDGSSFLGFSGILCGMLTFIWVRQKIAPWEGYPLPRSTFLFMLYFILTMLVIQMISFYLEIQYQLSISPGIANTAHLSGAAIGLLLGCLPFFSWKINQMQKGNHER